MKNFKVKRIPLTALQKALYTLLTAGQTTEVYDYLPDDSVGLPYITLGAATLRPGGAKDRDIYTCSMQMHIWSDYEGRAEVNTIMNDVATVITQAPLDMTADKFGVMSQDITFYEAFETDPRGYHGVMTLEAKIEDLDL